MLLTVPSLFYVLYPYSLMFSPRDLMRQVVPHFANEGTEAKDVACSASASASKSFQ